MRIALASLIQESNTFAPMLATMQSFRDDYLLTGPEVRVLRGTFTEIGGFFDVLEGAGVEAIPILVAHAISGGPVDIATFVELRERLLESLAAAEPFDAVLIALHGAMVVEGEDDGSGALLTAIRAMVGARPIGTTLDSHANVTAQMVNQADVIVGYRTFPHVDQYETGQRAARLLLDVLAGRLRPTIALAKLPMLQPAETHVVDREPLLSLWQQIEQFRGSQHIVDGGLFPVQPWLDLPDVGFSVLITTNGSLNTAQDVSRDLALRAWARRHDFRVPLLSADEAIRKALSTNGQPIVLSDSADGPGAGSPGDSTVVLKSLLDLGGGATSMLTMVDPEGVEICAARGPGATVRLKVGAKRDRFSVPIEVEGIVRFVGDVQFDFTSANIGTVGRMGRTAVMNIGSISLVLSERPVPTHDPALYRAVGLEPTKAKIVVVKSPAQFRAAYELLARDIINLDTPGHSAPNLRRLPYVRRPNPCFPFEDPREPNLQVTAKAPR